MNTAPYPLKLEGELDAPLSRWLWLVKWVLMIPHAIVLSFLWLAFMVLWVVAFFAILFTGRFPRAIFDFNVGVLRWTWRVSFYAYSALGTDRYPPFTLGDAPGYPARLDVAYPASLSRGLVLIKWWLLAIPQLIIAWALAYVVGALVLAAGIMLLFTGRYPDGLFTLTMGLDRWSYRVVAYTALMTDDYPPFRLDPGGHEPPQLQAPESVTGTPAAGMP